MLTKAEVELLLVSARQCLPDELSHRLGEIVNSPLRWADVIEEASRHGIGPMLFHHLESLPQRITIPTDEMHSLRQAYVRSAFRNRVHEEAIAGLLARFDKAGIKVVVLKGAGLVRTVYHDSALRPFADIDLLCEEHQVDQARELFLDTGYVIAPELLSEQFNRRYHTNLPFVRVEPVPVHVEFHWKLMDRFSRYSFDEAELLGRARPAPSGKSVGSVLEPEDDIVYLAAHLHNHGYLNAVAAQQTDPRLFVLDRLSANRLIWFTDLHELIGAGLSWSKVLDRAGAAKALGPLSVSLRLLMMLLGTQFDAAVLGELQLPSIAWPKRMLARYVFSLTDTENGSARRRRFEEQLLSTRRGFELRWIRLFDIWEYLFGNREGAKKSRPHLGQVVCALFRLVSMLVNFVYYRLFRLFGARCTR